MKSKVRVLLTFINLITSLYWRGIIIGAAGSIIITWKRVGNYYSFSWVMVGLAFIHLFFHRPSLAVLNVSHVPACGTAQWELLPGWGVIHPQGTLVFSGALGELVGSHFVEVGTGALLFVAGLTEMSVSPAEPLADWTAKLALEIDVLCAMFVAILDAGTYRLRRAARTHQLLRLKLLHALVSIPAVHHSSEIRIFRF